MANGCSFANGSLAKRREIRPKSPGFSFRRAEAKRRRARYEPDVAKPKRPRSRRDGWGWWVTTTEEIGDYADERLLELGDWLFPNVHPYWHGITDPKPAVEWTVEQFEQLKARSNKTIVFKEVGLPSAGDARVDEAKQAEYYRLLTETEVHFVAFEAFDGPWKDWAPVEPYWGLFRADRTPKSVVQVFSQNPSK